MPRDTWEENSACEIGALCLRLPHPVGRQQAHHEQKHDPRTVSLTLARQSPMTEGVPINRAAGDPQNRDATTHARKTAKSHCGFHQEAGAPHPGQLAVEIRLPAGYGL